MTSAEQQTRFGNAEYLRTIEKSLAFERASGVIESGCIAEPAGEDENCWWDLDSTEIDLSQEVEYLESRHLLKRHPDRPSWVMICDDEDEPYAPAVTEQPSIVTELPPLLQALKLSHQQAAKDFSINQKVIEIHQISERILAEAVKRWCDDNGPMPYAVDQIIDEAHQVAITEWEATHGSFEERS